MSLIYAPWTNEQVAALNRWQQCNHVHPFTCGNRDVKTHKFHAFFDLGVLEARSDGWHCLDCDYTQNWAHDFMLKLPENILVDWDYQNRKEKE